MTRSDSDALFEEVRALEILAEEVEVPPDRVQDYWSLSADLVGLASEVIELHPGDGPAIQALRRRLRQIAAGLVALTLD